MAQYNADIRVGITGKTQLNALERQLGRINKDLKQINKNLKAQTLTINTKGANRALDQLDRKINKLNRTIKVNASINERRSKSGGGGNPFISGGGIDPKQVALARAVVAPAKALTDEAQKQLDLEAEKQRQIDRLKKGQQDIFDNQKAINKLEDQRAKLQKSTNNRSAAAMFGAGTTRQQGLDKVNAKLKNSKDLLEVQNKVQKSIVQDTVAASRAAGQYNAQLRDGKNLLAEQNQKLGRRKQFSKGAQVGGGLIAASAASGIPLVGDAVTGGLAASFLPGATKSTVAGGAVAGLAVGAAAALAEFGAQAVQTATQVDKLRLSLELAAGSDFERSLETISTVVEDFNTPIENATTNFTKLYASAQGSGIAFADLSELFINLSAANKAFAGDAEDLNGILRAFTQIISKGTVQSEELKGQVGERLPGAFALAAESLGMTTAELQKALENGEVKSKEFVEKFGRYMRKFREDAAVIADAPQEAGARLTVALQNLQVDTGKELARLGAQFQNFATQAIKELTRLYNFLGQLGDELENRINRLGGNPTNDLEGYIQGLNRANEAIEEIQRNSLDPTRTNEAAKEDEANLKIWYQSRKDFQAKIDALKLGPPVPQTPPPSAVEDELDKTDSGSGSSPRESRAAQLRLQYQLAQGINDVEMSTLGVFEQQREQLELMNGIQVAELEYQNRLKEIALEELYPEERKYEILLAEEELRKRLIELKDQELQNAQDQAVAAEEAMRPLEDQRAILEATLSGGPEAAERVKLQQQARDIAAESTQLTQEEVFAYLLGNQELQKRIDLLNKQKETLEQIEGQIYQALGQAIEDVLVRGIAAAVSEAENLSEVLSDIGRQLLSTVGRILINAAINQAAGPGGLFGPQGLPGFKAKGGPINAGMPYIVGEQGPELVIPGAAGTVIPNDAFSAATQALQSNGRGTAAGVDGTASQGEAFAVANGARISNTENFRSTTTMNQIREYEERVMNNPEPLRVDYQSTVINNQTYVTEEQFQKGLTQSSNRARQATIRDLRNNPASRKMAGVNR